MLNGDDQRVTTEIPLSSFHMTFVFMWEAFLMNKSEAEAIKLYAKS